MFLVLLALAALVLLGYASVRLEQGRRHQKRRGRWVELAFLLEGRLEESAKGALRISGQRGEVRWELRSSAEVADDLAPPGTLFAWFDGADRLAPATLWREPGSGISEEALALGSELRALFRIDQGAVPAGCVQWVTDQAQQDLLIAMRPLMAAVVEKQGSSPSSSLEVALDVLELETIEIGLEWAIRLQALARDGVAAAPPH